MVEPVVSPAPVHVTAPVPAMVLALVAVLAQLRLLLFVLARSRTSLVLNQLRLCCSQS